MKTVIVIGAGASGLTTARALRRAGHHPIVLERTAEVGGKCASLDIGGRAFDLGGHVCTTEYRRLAALITELGLDTEPTTPHRVFDPATGESRPQSSAFFTYENFQRYTRIREAEFPRLAEPGLAHSAKALSIPARQWLEEHGLEAMAESFGIGYTAAGYGRLDDVPALYFLKYAEMTGLLSSTRDLLGHAGSFTVTGGFGRLWQRVAEDLDVRLNVEIERITRHANGVRVKAGEWIDADALVLTVPIDQIPALDATPEERDIAARVRYLDYRTLLCAAEGLPRKAFSLLTRPRGLVSCHHRYDDSDVYACYAYGEVSPEIGAIRQEYVRKDWKFLPHFGPDDLAAGVLDRIEAMQGDLHTFHVGSLPAFELVECVIGYAEDLVAKHFGSAATTIREWLVQHIAAELRVPEHAISPAAPLASLGLESLSVAALRSGLSDWLGFRVPHTLFLELPTVDAIAEHLVRQDAPASSLALALTAPRPFFCVGGAVGAAHYLLPLARAVGQGQPFYGLQGPGFDGTEDPIDDIPALAARYLTEIKKIQPHGPYLVGGHSFGGIVAYEIGRQLRLGGDEVARVIMIDAYPAVPGQAEPPWDERAVIEELWTIRQHAFQDAGAPRRRVDQSLTPREQREQLGRFLGASGSRPVEEHIATITGVYQAQVEALVRYEPPAADLDVTLIKATGGFPRVLGDDRHVELFLDSPANGWERVPMRSFEVVRVTGDHFTVLVPPALTGLADAVRTAIAKVPPPPPPPAAHVESSLHINPMHPDFLADPYPFYALLRDLAPVHHDEALDGWVLTRHADVTDVLRRPTVVRPSTATLMARLPDDVLEEMNPFIRRLDASLPFSNRPAHTRLRKLMNRSFTPRAMEQRRAVVEETCRELLDGFTGGDFLTQVAYPFPARVVMDLVGVPREDQPQLTRWGTDVMKTLGEGQFGADPVAVAHTSSTAMDALMAYLRDLVAQRRHRPCDDLISEQLHACDADPFGERGEWQDDDELVVNVISLINAGLETTANYLGNGVLALLRHPAQYRLLRTEPIAETAAEELLRYDSPAPIITPQLATEDLEIGGRRIRAGELLFPVLGAANRDPAKYTCPDTLDLTRQSAVTHLTFGAGIHYCVGAFLGRLEGQVLFPMLARRFPELRLDPDAGEPEFRPDPALRGLKELRLLVRDGRRP